jgi:hypothetical protein
VARSAAADADAVAAPESPALVFGTGAHVGGTFGAVPFYVDDAVRALVVLSPAPGSGGSPAEPIVAVATDAGAVHFLQVCAPPPAR